MDNMTQQEEHIFCSTFESVPVPDNLTLPEFVLQDAELYADKVAFVDVLRSKEITYGEVIKNTKRFATALRSLGLRKGHVVVVLLPNVAEYATIALGIMTAGGVFSGANPAVITIDEEMIEGAMNWHNLLQAGERAGTNNSLNEIIQQTDLCALPFSSGTTGISKGVMLTHRNLIANLCSTLFGIRPEMIGKVTVLGLMPFFHIYGIAGICCAALKNKGKVVVMGRYELRTFMNALITQEINFAPIVPPIISDMVKKPMIDEFDLTKLKLQAIMTAAAPLAPELLKAFEIKFPDHFHLVKVKENSWTHLACQPHNSVCYTLF